MMKQNRGGRKKRQVGSLSVAAFVAFGVATMGVALVRGDNTSFGAEGFRVPPGLQAPPRVVGFPPTEANKGTPLEDIPRDELGRLQFKNLRGVVSRAPVPPEIQRGIDDLRALRKQIESRQARDLSPKLIPELPTDTFVPRMDSGYPDPDRPRLNPQVSSALESLR